MPGEAARSLDAHLLTRELLSSLAHSGLAASSEPAGLALSLSACVRIAELCGLARLGKVADRFPATIQALMPTPEDEIELQRDAGAEAQEFLRLLDVVDILSDDELACVSPRLHRGWQDKRQSCRNARELARSVLDVRLDESARAELLKSIAIYHRLFLVPPPVGVDAVEVHRAVGAVLDLITDLLEPDDKASAGWIEKLRESLGGDLR